jgi:hypothetical protein
MHVGLPNNDCTGFEQRLNNSGVTRWQEFGQRWSPGRVREANHLDVVLYRDRYTAQWQRITTRLKVVIIRICLLQGGRCINADKCVQLREVRDPRKPRFHKLAACDPSMPNQGRRFGEGELPKMLGLCEQTLCVGTDLFRHIYWVAHFLPLLAALAMLWFTQR